MKFKLCVLFLIFVIGCSKVDESVKDNDSKETLSANQVQTQEKVVSPKKNSDVPDDGKIMSAEEQLKQYYAEKGIEYPVSEKENENAKQELKVVNYMADDGKVMSAEEQLRQYYAEKGMEYPDSGKIEKYTVDDPVFYTSPSTQQEQESADNVDESGDPVSQRSVARQSPSQELIDNLNDSIDEEDQGEPQPEYSDSEPPELISIRFVPGEILPGKEAEVVVQAVDNLSGVKSIFGVMKSPSENAMVSFSCPLLNSDGTFTGVVKIPDHAEAGKWFLRSMRVTDKVFNTQNYSKNHAVLSNIYITVNASDSDIAAPELISIFIDPPQAYGKDQVTIMVDAVDNKSGVYRVYGLLASPSNNAKLSFACQYSKELNIFEGNVTIPANAESGDWQVEYMRLEDKAKNAKTYYKRKSTDIFQTAKVNVLTEGSDSEPPVLEDIYITPTTVVYEEIVKIHVRVTDDISGVASVNGRIHKSPSGQAYIPFYCKYDAEEDEFIAEIIIQRNTEVGLWEIDNLVISDKARNQSRLVRIQDPILQQANFEVLGE